MIPGNKPGSASHDTSPFHPEMFQEPRIDTFHYVLDKSTGPAGFFHLRGPLPGWPYHPQSTAGSRNVHQAWHQMRTSVELDSSRVGASGNCPLPCLAHCTAPVVLWELPEVGES